MSPARDPFGVPRLRGLEPPEGGTPNGPIILWTGPKHSGKTSSAALLVEAARGRGFIVAGCLAPSVHAEDVLLGFDLVDLRSGRRAPLARRDIEHPQDRSFHFLPDGLRLGDEALGPAATRGADLIIIDEYGPWELKSQLWRHATDRLVRARDPKRGTSRLGTPNDHSPLRHSTRSPAAQRPSGPGAGTDAVGPQSQKFAIGNPVLLLVVREELVDEVLRLYASRATRRLAALAPESVDEVLALLENRRQSFQHAPY